jgi:hypothetical protein
MRSFTRNGYGQVFWINKQRSTHRLAWELSTGIDADGLCVCHHCDNPKCANPDHLFIGTSAENTADRTAKGREARGEKANHSDLKERDVIDIRLRCVVGSKRFGYTALAKEYGVTPSSIANIIKRKYWTHL